MNDHNTGLIGTSVRAAPSPFAAVAVTDGMELRSITLAVCRELKRRFGSKIYVYVRSNDSRRYYEPFVEEKIVDEIIHANVLRDTMMQPVSDMQGEYAKAREHELLLGCTYNSVRMTRRDIGLGFYLGGFNHPTSIYAVKTSYVQMIAAFNRAFDFWQHEYESKGITLHLNGLKEEAVVARARGVPFRYLYAARVENNFFWAHSELIDYPEVAVVYRSMEAENFQAVGSIDQYYSDVGQRRRITEVHPLSRLLSRLFSTTLGYLYRWKHRDEFTPSYFYTSMVKYLWREFVDMRKLLPPRTKLLAGLKGQRFVYFPLHTEPEMSLHWMSPEYFNQLSAIGSLARDLPADTMLAVKETIYGVGRRPRDFYEQIERLRNTALLDVFELGVDVVKAADVVVTISGTAGLEAAILGKPVILFGRHNFYACVPHVLLVTREEDLKPALDWALSPSFDHEKARRDGARLRAATLRASFDLGKYSNLAYDAFNDLDIQRATDALVSGICTILDQTEMTGAGYENRG
jgi:hypothetical protein